MYKIIEFLGMVGIVLGVAFAMLLLILALIFIVGTSTKKIFGYEINPMALFFLITLCLVGIGSILL